MMLRSIRLQNFKCFADQTVALGPLTLLSGQNGTGKSSVIQSLLLLKQSYAHGLIHGLMLNGELVSLGTATDVLYEGAPNEIVTVSVESDSDDPWSATSSLPFDASNPDADVLHLHVGHELGSMPNLEYLKYLAAERIGPRDAHITSDYHVSNLGDVRSDGGYAVAFLHEHAQRIVHPVMRKAEADSNRLIDQVAAWLGEVSPGVRLDTERSRSMSRAALLVSFRSGAVTSR